jgi:hypothetical protein
MPRSITTTTITVVLLVGVGAGMAFVPDAFAVIETMFFGEELFADREEHALSVRFRACRSIARACGIRLIDDLEAAF